MKNKRVLILGGGGFIGKSLAKSFSRYEYEVISFDLTIPNEQELGIQYVSGNFYNDEDIFKCISDVDLIIHAISVLNPGNSGSMYMQGYEKDFIQSIKIFDYASKHDIQVIFLSSGGTVYGVKDRQPITEECLPRPINHYGNVKLSIENVLLTFNRQRNSKMRIARISNPYGPGQDYNKGVGFIDAALKLTIEQKPIEIWGDGEIVRDYIYIEDVCEMIVKLSSYMGNDEIFNISSNEGISLNSVVKYIEKLGLKPKVIYQDGRNVDVPIIILDNSKILALFDAPLQSFEMGLKTYYKYLTTIE